MFNAEEFFSTLLLSIMVGFFVGSAAAMMRDWFRGVRR